MSLDKIVKCMPLSDYLKMKEKAKLYDQLPIDDEGSMYSQKNLDRLQEWKEKAEALDILEYGYPQEVQKALEKVRGRRRNESQ